LYALKRKNTKNRKIVSKRSETARRVPARYDLLKGTSDANSLNGACTAAVDVHGGYPDNPAPMYSKDAAAVYYDVAPMKYNGSDDYKQGFLKAFAGAVAQNDGEHFELAGRTART
jgi:hypothetical protein